MNKAVLKELNFEGEIQGSYTTCSRRERKNIGRFIDVLIMNRN